MPDGLDLYFDLHALLDAIEAAPPVAAIDVLSIELAKAIDAREASFLIADFSGYSLIRLTHVVEGKRSRRQGDEAAEPVPLVGTPHGKALRTQQVEVVSEDEGVRLFAPVTDRGDAIGILELLLTFHPDEQTIAYIASAAHAFAYVVIANRRYTDLFEWGRRTTPLTLAAEIQHRLLPASFTCEAGQFALAGWLEPSGDVNGDTFDYALDRTVLHVSITDAMGHSIDSALLATLLVGSLRNSRRRGAGLAEQARLANDAVNAHARNEQFVTGQILRIDLSHSTAAIINAGHPPPFRVRNGRAEELELAADPPFGILPTAAYRVQLLPLELGDRIVFLTDGLLERHAARVDVATVLAKTRDLHPREAVQALTLAVRHAADGQLCDDATVLCLDWYGGAERDREAFAGASQGRASAALLTSMMR